MEQTLWQLLDSVDKGKYRGKNIHIVRFYSSYVIICDGKAVEATDPLMFYCPLAEFFYRDIKKANSIDTLKHFLLTAINNKIAAFGHFTDRRELWRKDIAVPYGASEMLMYALRKRNIEAACIVCDGAGTVITDKPEVVQGVGARMQGLFYTSPIARVIEALTKTGAHILSGKADIDQAAGVEQAALLGYKRIAVTVNASMDESFITLRDIEKSAGVSLTILAVCTTGIAPKRVREIGDYADLVWSCASENVRTMAGKRAILQLSHAIPVFILSHRGLIFTAAYSADPDTIQNLDARKQYIIAKGASGKEILMGDFVAHLGNAVLPVRSKKEPLLQIHRCAAEHDACCE
ncbi:MAG: DUF2099 family protein [Candidatus Omnitrophica bacterium]|nr:DUF2099 family protein [Candidatus Omnitrophota bacterium]